MDAVGIIGLAASISLLSGWRLYLCIFATGLAMHVGWIALPQQLQAVVRHTRCAPVLKQRPAQHQRVVVFVGR